MIIGNMRNIIEFSCHMDCDCEDLNAVFASGRQSMSTVQALSRLVEWQTESREDSYDQEDELRKASDRHVTIATRRSTRCRYRSRCIIFSLHYQHPPMSHVRCNILMGRSILISWSEMFSHLRRQSASAQLVGFVMLTTVIESCCQPVTMEG